MSDAHFVLRFAAVLVVALVAACGADTKTGSNGTGSVVTEHQDAFVAGTLVAADPFSVGTSQIQAATTPVRIDETPDAGAGSLRLGMNLEGTGIVVGTFGAVPGVLQAGDSQGIVRGFVSTVDIAANRFTVATITFTVDANTLYDAVPGLAGLAPGAYVEVSGLPLADLRTALATRVTQTPSGDGRLSIAARIDSFTPQGLALAGISVPGASSAGFNPVPPVGSLIRVTGTYNPATHVMTNEQVSILPQFAPANHANIEVEGIVLDMAAAGGFVLRTAARDYDVAPGATLPAPISSGLRVRVIGMATGPSSLMPTSATVIGGQLAYQVTGVVSEFSSLAALRVRGEPVDLTAAAIHGGNASDIGNGRRLSIVGTAGPGALRVSDATLQP